MTSVGQTSGHGDRARNRGEPVRPVEVVREGFPRSGKVRTRYLDDDQEGLEEWVPKIRLVCRWEEAGAFQEGERRLLLAYEASGAIEETVPFRAAEWVFSAMYDVFGRELVMSGWRGIERELVTIRDFGNSAREMHLDPKQLLSEPYAFVDRHGNYWAPGTVAERIARLLCQRFPKEILRSVQADEQKWRQETVTYSDSSQEAFHRKWLDAHKPMSSLVREWCGEKAAKEFDEVTALREKIRRLRALVQSTAAWIREAGHPVKASTLLKQLNATQYGCGTVTPSGRRPNKGREMDS